MDLYLYSPHTPLQGEQGHISIFYLLPISVNKKLVFRDVYRLRIATNTYVDRIVKRLKKNMHKQLEGVVQRIVRVTLYITSVECCNTGVSVSSRLVNLAQKDQPGQIRVLMHISSAATQFAF
jgi:hypothetical protein